MAMSEAARARSGRTELRSKIAQLAEQHKQAMLDATFLGRSAEQDEADTTRSKRLNVLRSELLALAR